MIKTSYAPDTTKMTQNACGKTFVHIEAVTNNTLPLAARSSGKLFYERLRFYPQIGTTQDSYQVLVNFCAFSSVTLRSDIFAPNGGTTGFIGLAPFSHKPEEAETNLMYTLKET